MNPEFHFVACAASRFIRAPGRIVLSVFAVPAHLAQVHARPQLELAAELDERVARALLRADPEKILRHEARRVRLGVDERAYEREPGIGGIATLHRERNRWGHRGGKILVSAVAIFCAIKAGGARANVVALHRDQYARAQLTALRMRWPATGNII